MGLTVSGFMVMGLVSRFSLANHLTQGPSWWHTHCSAKMDSSEEDSGRLAGHMDWHFLFLLHFPEFFQLVGAC